MSVRSRSQVISVAPAGVAPAGVAPISVAPTGVGLESRLAQVLTVGQRTFGHQTDATGVRPGKTVREKRDEMLAKGRAEFKKQGMKSPMARMLARVDRTWDDDYDTWTPHIHIKDFGTITSSGRGVAAKGRITVTWDKVEGLRTSLVEAVAEVLKGWLEEWLTCEMEDGNYGIVGAGTPTVMSKNPNGPTALNDVEIVVQAADAGAAMAMSLVAKIVELIDPNAPRALAPGYFNNVEKSPFPCPEKVVENEYPSSEESGSEEEEEEDGGFQAQAKNERAEEAAYNAFMREKFGKE